MKKRIFVTVGTTKFPKLINTITNEKVIRSFISLGYDYIQIQTGKDVIKPPVVDLPHTIKQEGTSVIIEIQDKLVIKYDSYFEDFEQEIVNSDLVISHAGAGTCLEVLKKGKHLLVVVNEDLMDNHQIELAGQLQDNGYLYYCTCDTLNDMLYKNFLDLKQYGVADRVLFSNYLDKSMGFA
ncbi:unnamed protein product [Diabrotica balteata]|uniref:UDP-N-acetylglucosamine transferase subunit ALG13 n=1 Tax=Diabrotica balteata TaxID=107213 RepID=A0A9N9SYV6_DIABA|nr:unnamed protein product [Diabrotica balteata]